VKNVPFAIYGGGDIFGALCLNGLGARPENATRPRVSLFTQRFHNLGLIRTNKDRFFIIKEKSLADYPSQIA
jgi:hypothetical protein